MIIISTLGNNINNNNYIKVTYRFVTDLIKHQNIAEADGLDPLANMQTIIIIKMFVTLLIIYVISLLFSG